MTRTPAQIKAQRKADKKRSNRPLFTIRMSQEEKEFCNEVLENYDSDLSKKDTLILAIKRMADGD